jgi:manganese transport protein
MNLNNILKDLKSKHSGKLVDFEFFKYIGPGLLVTVGFIDPGNWGANIAAGSGWGFDLLWIVTMSTIMLILLQHNVAHLGIASGYCLSEATTIYLNKNLARTILISAVFASISTVLAELLGGAIALNMIFHIPVKLGAVIIGAVSMGMVFSNSYRMIEKWIIGFVSVIGLSFVFELTLVDIDWSYAVKMSITPSLPSGSMIIIMSVLGSVIMPHNLFLHSEIIQSRKWNLADEKIIKKQLKFELFDTFFSMIIGWIINCAMIILAASVFYKNNIHVSELQQAKAILGHLLHNSAGIVFAIALLFAGLSSSITAGIASGSIFAGIYEEPFNLKDFHTKLGVYISFFGALLIIFFIKNPYHGLIISQVILSLQLPFTIFAQIYLTSSKKVMGKFANSLFSNIILITIGSIVSSLNIYLIWSLFF